MGLYVSTTGSNVTITEWGLTIPHPTTDFDVGAQFNPDDVKIAESLTAAIVAGTLVWKKVALGAAQTPANYDPDFLRLDQENTGGATTDQVALKNQATTSVDGLMSAADKTKLNGLYAGASVTSVALALPPIFTVSGSPVTSSGTLTGSLATQTANTLWVGPTSGGVATPTFRTLVTADIPDGIITLAKQANVATSTIRGRATAGSGAPEDLTAAQVRTIINVANGASVSSVAMTVPSDLSVSGTPITSSGTFAITRANQNANLIMAGPTTGAAAAPTFRSMVAADIPNTAVTAGTYGVGFGNTFTVDAAGRLTATANGKMRRTHRLTGTQVSSSTTFAALTELTSGSIPIGNYSFRSYIRIQSAAASNGYGIRLNVGSATATDFMASWQLPTNVDFSTTHFNTYSQRAFSDNNITGTIGAANTDYMVVGQGFFSVTVAGTIAIEFRSENNGTNVTAGIGSCLIIEEL